MLTYRELAVRTGWSRAIIGEYLAGTALPPTDRFDHLVRLLGATGEEMGPLATARDRAEELRRPSRMPAGRAPRELPAPVLGFVGRHDHLETLDRLADNGGSGLALVVICGSAGMGKTALAVLWSHRNVDQFRDGQLYADMRGFSSTQPVEPGDVLARFLHALGEDPARLPATTDARAAIFRTLVAGRRLLIVLDNVRCAEQVRPLLPGSATCMVIVTSRDSLAGLVAIDGASRIVLDVLSGAEAMALLRSRVGGQIAVASDQAIAMARLSGRTPLALRVAAEFAASRAPEPFAEVVADLCDRQDRLDLLDAGDSRSDLRSVLSWSYERLSPAAARLFRLFGAVAGPELSLRAVASLAAVSVVDARRLLGELSRAHMLTEHSSGRYALPGVLKAYAAELIGGEPDGERHTALNRLLDHYLRSVVAARRLLDTAQTPAELPRAVEAVVVAAIDTPTQAAEWLQMECNALRAARRLASDRGFVDHARLLAWATRRPAQPQADVDAPGRRADVHLPGLPEASRDLTMASTAAGG
jgi:hypothetical protein